MAQGRAKTGSRQLPKFDSTPWLAAGAAVSFSLTGLSLWALFAQWHAAFIPFQLGKILGALTGVVLGAHCIDMVKYYRKHGRLKR